jgi:hypothetical protein
MNAGELFGMGLLWMAAAGIASGIAEKNGWGQWKWYLASMALGPLAWIALFFKLRDFRERKRPLGHRGPYYRRVRPRTTARIIR